MIKHITHKDGKPLYGFGLSAGNCERLVAGYPIIVDLDVMCRDMPPSAMRGAVMIHGGKTETDMVDELKRLGLIGEDTAIAPIEEHQSGEPARPYRMPPPEHHPSGRQLVGPNVKSFTVAEWCPSSDGTGPATAVAIAIETEKHGDIVLRMKSAAEVDRIVQMLLRHKRGVWPESA